MDAWLQNHFREAFQVKTHYVYDDGGRKKAGYRGYTGDCVVRAVAIATQIPYPVVYKALNTVAKEEKPSKRGKRSNARTGVYKHTIRNFLTQLGWVWTPTMRIGQGCKTHLKAGELPSGRLIAQVSKHLVAVVDGVIHDTSDPSRGGSRCVYGYWQKGKA